MYYPLSIEKRIQNAGNALTNSLDSEILPLIEVLGYREEKIAVGSSLYENVLTLIAKNKQEYGEKYGVTSELNRLFDEAQKVHQRTVMLAKTIYRNDIKVVKELGLNESRESSYSRWILQATTFYKNITQEHIDAMAQFSYTPEKFAQEAALVEGVSNALATQ